MNFKIIKRSINPFRNEYACTDALRVSVNRLMRKGNYPSWMLPLNLTAKKCFVGGYKQVYVYNNYAIAISKKTMDVGHLKSKFEKVNEKVPYSLNYPEETTQIGEYFVAKLRKCSDSLVEKLISGQQGWEDQMVRLGRALRKLHKEKVMLSDIKPDNILVCGNVLSFGDIDDAYDIEKRKGKLKITPPFSLLPYWDEYGTGPTRPNGRWSENHLNFLDWYAFGYCVLLSCKKDGYSGVILNSAIECVNARVPFRMFLDLTKYKNIHPVVRTCCDWMLLSNGEYIDPTPMASFFKQKKWKKAVRAVTAFKWNLKY